MTCERSELGLPARSSASTSVAGMTPRVNPSTTRVASQAPAGTVALAVGAAVAVWQEPLVVRLFDDDFLDFDEEVPLPLEQPQEHADGDAELLSGVTSREGCS